MRAGAFRRSASRIRRVKERSTRGKAAREPVPRSDHAALGAGGRARDPGRAPARAGRGRGCPSWCRSATAGWSRRRSRSIRGAAADHGGRPRADPAPGSPSSCCGDAHLSNFGVLRLARAAAGLRHQRLRRDAARARGSGTSSGWRRASRSPAGTAASTRRSGARPSIAAVARRTARRCASSRAMRNLERLVRAARRRAACSSHARASRSSRQASASALDKRVAKARTQGQPARARRSSRTWSTASRGSSADPPLIVPIEELFRPATSETARGRRCAGCSARTARTLQPDRRHLLERFRLRRHRAQGRRRRQRRHPRLDRAAARPRRRRPAVPAGEGGAAARCSSRSSGRSEYAQPRPAGGRGAAADAGDQRHLPRLGAGRGRRRQRATSTCASCGTGRARRDGRADGAGAADASTAGSAGGPSPGRTPGPATGSRSRPTSAGGDAFDRALADFAEAYADQNERDHAALDDAARAGRVAAERGV